jgi:hypothetical protein
MVHSGGDDLTAARGKGEGKRGRGGEGMKERLSGVLASEVSRIEGWPSLGTWLTNYIIY